MVILKERKNRNTYQDGNTMIPGLGIKSILEFSTYLRSTTRRTDVSTLKSAYTVSYGSSTHLISSTAQGRVEEESLGVSHILSLRKFGAVRYHPPVSHICALMRLPSGWVTTIVANSTPTVVFRSDLKLGTVPSALGRLSCISPGGRPSKNRSCQDYPTRACIDPEIGDRSHNRSSTTRERSTKPSA